jgi:serine/threonine protein kinase
MIEQRIQPPPEIPGYIYKYPIGHGGFSDVYLYQQLMPRRDVAIKVLRTDALTDASRRQFSAEANLMARLSNHTNIASIYSSDVDGDGQPYLVMEYCSGGSLGEHYRNFPLSVKDVLTLGVRLSSALEAAHRAGIVHRDVKPANILLTEYGVPVLSDFGISTIDEDFPDATIARAQVYATVGAGPKDIDTSDSIGLSLPWAAPETLAEPPTSDTRSDRYSLAATLYSLLEGRSPHEVPGGPNGASHLTGRIHTGFVAQMQRADVPQSLRALLRRGLSYDPDARFDSSIAMAQALQDVQRELGFEVTPLEVPKGSAPAPEPPDPAETRVRPRAAHEVVRMPVPEGHQTLAPGEMLPEPHPSPAGPLPSSPVTPSAPTSATPSAIPPAAPYGYGAPGATPPAQRDLYRQQPAPARPNPAPAVGPNAPNHGAPQVAPPQGGQGQGTYPNDADRPTNQYRAPGVPDAPPDPGRYAVSAPWQGATGQSFGHSSGGYIGGFVGTPSRGRGRAVLIGIGIVLVVAAIVFAAWRLSRPESPTTFDGRAIDNVEVRPNNGGAFVVTVPAGLDDPEAVEFRVIDPGDGDPVGDGDDVTVSTDYSGWYDQIDVTLNPTETLSYGAEVTMPRDDLIDALGDEVPDLREGMILLVAAPEAYFVNVAPQLEVNSSSAQLVLILIVEP